MFPFSTDLEATYNHTIGVLHCGGIEIKNVRMMPLKQCTKDESNCRLDTVGITKHVNPNFEVRCFHVFFCLLQFSLI